MLWYVPIEPYERRYSAQWIRWFEEKFKERQIRYRTILGESISDKVSSGSVFNPVSISHYRATQLRKIHYYVATKEIKNGDKLFFDDGQFPGVDQIQHYLDQIDLKIDLYCYMHAGSWDDWDYTTRYGMERWLRHIERGWFVIYKKIFVASEHHRNMILNVMGNEYKDKIVVTGSPLNTQSILATLGLSLDEIDNRERKYDIVFPHRLDEEKCPQVFKKIVKELSLKGIATAEYNFSKKEYYDVLSQSKIVFSSAMHENFGISIVEGILFGCIPVLPNRLSYKEMYPKMFLYDSYEEAVCKIKNFLQWWNTEKGNREKLIDLRAIVKKYDGSIDRILSCMGFK